MTWTLAFMVRIALARPKEREPCWEYFLAPELAAAACMMEVSSAEKESRAWKLATCVFVRMASCADVENAAVWNLKRAVWRLPLKLPRPHIAARLRICCG